MFGGESHTTSKTPIVYVSSSVTNASDKYRLFIQEFKKELRLKTPALVLEWQDKDAPITEGFFKRNLRNVEMCTVMIAFVDGPSIGVGLEIAEALTCKKPLLCLHKEDAVVSRLLLAAPSGFPIKNYKTLDEAVDIASKFIIEHQPRLHA